MRVCALLLAFALAGCGVDGPPVPPQEDDDALPPPGVTISGTASIGVSSG
jgi:predicted small lipoprotein YifL